MKKRKLSPQYRPGPNAAHRAERWSGAKAHRNRKKYTRKGKERWVYKKGEEG